MDWKDKIEDRWELGGFFGCYTAKHICEIPPERSEALSETMAAVEMVGRTFPWTLSAMTRWGLRRRMRRYEKHYFNPLTAR